jgi:hypothetical protein
MEQYCVTQFCAIQICATENPFQFGRELGIDELVNREEEVDEVVRTIRQGGKLFLSGPRRYGKTSDGVNHEIHENGSEGLRGTRISSSNRKAMAGNCPLQTRLSLIQS